jgi:TonB family protein
LESLQLGEHEALSLRAFFVGGSAVRISALPLIGLLILVPASAEQAHQTEEPTSVQPPPLPPAPNLSNIFTRAISFGRHSCDENEYPVTALQEGAEGTTRVRLRIGTSGEVIDVAVGNSSGRQDLDQASVACAKTWRYLPAFRGSTPVESVVLSDIIWRMSADGPFYEIVKAHKECVRSTEEGRREHEQAALHTVVRIHYSNGQITSVTLLASSGISDLDQRNIDCFKSIPRELTKTIAGEVDDTVAAYWVDK